MGDNLPTHPEVIIWLYFFKASQNLNKSVKNFCDEKMKGYEIGKFMMKKKQNFLRTYAEKLVFLKKK